MKKWYKKQNNVIAVGAAMILLIAIGYSYFSTPKEELQTGMIIKVNYKDGSSQIFDTNTLTPGAIVGINRPGFASTSVVVNVKPIVTASDGSNPTTRVPGHPIMTNPLTSVRIMASDGSGRSIALIKTWDVGAIELTPNTDNNILVNKDSTITLSDLETATNTALPNGGNFDVDFLNINMIQATLDGTAKAGFLPSAKMTFRKDVGTAGTNILSAGTQICYFNTNGQILSSSSTNYNVQLSSRTTPVVLSSSQFTVGTCGSPPTLPTTTTYILQSVSVSGSFN